MVTVFSNHAALKYLLTKKEAKPRLVRCILLLQEFNLQIKDQEGSENLAADHLSRLIKEEEVIPIREVFSNEQVMEIQVVETPWFADITNYIVTGVIPSEFNKNQRDKLRSNAKCYLWEDHICSSADQVIRRCVQQSECLPIFAVMS